MSLQHSNLTTLDSARSASTTFEPTEGAFLPGLPVADVAPRNIPKRGIPQFLNENIPQDYKATVAKILELEQKLDVERTYKHYLEALASAANISLEDR